VIRISVTASARTKVLTQKAAKLAHRLANVASVEPIVGVIELGIKLVGSISTRDFRSRLEDRLAKVLRRHRSFDFICSPRSVVADSYSGIKGANISQRCDPFAGARGCGRPIIKFISVGWSTPDRASP
jgi:hypothetical protein